MQNKGAVKFLAIVLAIACLYQLSFTFVTRNVENKARELSGGNPAAEAQYLDSMRAITVYNLGFIEYNYSECKEKEINLGLDLKGGMNVTLQIAVKDVLVAISNNSTDANFNAALAKADEKQKNSRADYITLFEESYKEVAPNGQLKDIFSTYDMKEKITPDMNNAQVLEVLRKEAESAISNSFNVLRSRIDRFGVTQPNIQRLENSGRILVELPGVKEPERVRKLLQGTASLEFWATYRITDLMNSLMQINERIASMENSSVAAAAETTTETAEADSTATATEDDVVAKLLKEKSDSTAISKSSPLFSKFMPSVDQSGRPYDSQIIGRAMSSDTASVNQMLNSQIARQYLPRGIRFMWGVKADNAEGTLFSLYAINGNTKDGKAIVDGSDVKDSSPNYSQHGSAANVSMTMTASGAKKWARMTGDNVGKAIAIVLDGYVYSAPNVQNEITGGSSEITGNFTINEATDLANVLRSGKLPAPARIIQEAVVGPSLGQESIDAGMLSFIIAFIFVLAYMIFYYNTAGIVASVALLTNLFFLFGILASFGAVLTLPGIAGIVLTMGMAVDANVIIYERIKEEFRSGKGLSASLADGFRQAYSAIIDGNATTFITGIVLFAFGSGPVQGFATTLIIGILTSLFTSIFITRVIFVSMIEKGINISFSNSLTAHVLEKANVNFIKIRKVAYIISGIMILASVISLATNKLSMGVDFSGGRTYVVRFDNAVSSTVVREALAKDEAFQSGLEVKQFDGETQMRLITQYRFDEEGETVTDEINAKLYSLLNPLNKTSLTELEFTTNINENGILSSDKVGPTVAHDITINSFIAVIFALLAIGLYIVLRFRKWQWAVGGVISLFHDAFITIGVFSMLYKVMPFEMDVNQSFIAAILTIIGYSINDTVVIFDRIREYIGLYPKRTISHNINAAVNSTLARTLNTAGTTLVVLLAMFIFGGVVIRGFVFALAFGVFIGTYSSIFIATPVAFDMMPKRDKK